MTRREIIEAAKQLVLIHGPANVLEFGEELLDQALPWLDRVFITDEASKQAERVYDFLGYESPWKV